MERLAGLIDRAAYRLAFSGADRILVSSFYPAKPKSARVRVIGPIIGATARALQPVTGDYLLAYLNKGKWQLTPSVENALQDCYVPVILYGTDREGRQGNITFKRRSRHGFLADLAGCAVVLSTAGNQLVGEALYFGKPLLVMPERTAEQRLNGAGVVQMGIGECLPFGCLTADWIRGFVKRRDVYGRRARSAWRDGCAEAVADIEQWLGEVSAAPQAATEHSSRVAA